MNDMIINVLKYCDKNRQINWNDSKKMLNYIIFCLQLFVFTIASAQNVTVKKQQEDVFFWIEAEAGKIIDPMLIHYSEKASGGQYIEVRGGNNNIKKAPNDGLAFYNFEVEKAGLYKIWGRVKIDMDDEDAFWVKMDDRPWIRWMDIDVDCRWHWDEVHDNKNNNQVMMYDLDAGPHTLIITYGMDQTRLDKILITNAMGYNPKGKGPGIDVKIETSPDIILVGKKTSFDGSGSISSEGSIKSYNWQINGKEISDRVEADFVFKNPGKYKVKLLITDETGLTGQLIKVTQVYTDEPIVRVTHFPEFSKPRHQITFDASESFDPNGKITKYRWDFGDGTAESGSLIQHSYLKPGKYTVKITLTDNDGISKSESFLVTIITGTPKKIIYETDMCLDVDDVGALAMLHGLANKDEVELLGVCFNEAHPFGAPAIDAINTWYGRGDIPVGIYKKNLPDPDPSVYLEAIAKFPHDLETAGAPSALDVYKDVLSKQPDNSVTIISVGFIINIFDLLKAEPELVSQKVKELVIMGGAGGGGFNLGRHNTAAQSEFVLENWPTPMVFSGAGTGILTGEKLQGTSDKNPVKEAYRLFFYNHFCGRHSWDQMAVLYGVRGISDYFSFLKDVDRWGLKPGMRSSIELKLDKNDYARVVEELMMCSPLKF